MLSERDSEIGRCPQGLHWRYSSTEPYNGTVRFADGSAKTYATRERPHVVFDKTDLNSTTPVGVSRTILADVSAVLFRMLASFCACNINADKRVCVGTGDHGGLEPAGGPKLRHLPRGRLLAVQDHPRP